MTQRRITATPVSTFVQPVRPDLNSTRQVTQTIKGLGALLGGDRERRFNVVVAEGEKAKRQAEMRQKRADRAAANNKARELEAHYMPKMKEFLDRPGTYDLSPDEFMDTPIYREGADMIQREIADPIMQQHILGQYQSATLGMYTKGKTRHQYNQRSHSAALAQKAGAARGINEQMAAYDDAVASGISRDDAFASGMAAAQLQGLKYLKEFSTARDWTPEQQSLLTKALVTTEKVDKTAANTAYLLAGTEQGRREQLNAYTQVLQDHAEILSDSQKAGAVAKTQRLREEIQTEDAVRSLFGRYTKRELEAGRGLEGQRLLSRVDLDKLHNEEMDSALDVEDWGRVMYLAQQPGDEPAALKDVFSNTIEAIGTVDPVNPESIASIEELLAKARMVDKVLGPERVRGMMSPRQYATYQQLAGIAHFQGAATATAMIQQVQERRASGGAPAPSDWKPNAIIEYAQSRLADVEWSAWDRPVATGQIRSMLTPYLSVWKELALTEEAMMKNVDNLMANSSWNGMINGSLIGVTLDNMTNVDGGNPYDLAADELFEAYKAETLKELQVHQPNLTDITIRAHSNDPSVLIIESPDGLPIVDSKRTLEDMRNTIRAAVPTRAEKVINDRNKRDNYESGGLNNDTRFNWQNIR